jgi:hypothetical protein
MSAYHDRGFNSPCSICPNLYGKHNRSNGQQVNRRLLGVMMLATSGWKRRRPLPSN